MDAISAWAKAPLSPDTKIYRDLGLFGDDFSFGLAPILHRLGATSLGLNIYDCIPREWEMRECTVPDLTLKELYAFAEFKPDE